VSDPELFKLKIRDAVRAAAETVAETNGNDAIAGFALCPDCDLVCFYEAYVTHEDLAELQVRLGDDVRFIAGEGWELSPHEDLFRQLSCELRVWEAESAGSWTDYDMSRVERFDALVGALELCRREKVFSDSTFLIVQAANPDEFLQELSRKAAWRLNGAEIAAEYGRVI
jgi:hypothetical protein